MCEYIYGIFGNISDSNFTFRPKAQKQRLKRKRLATCQSVFFNITIRDNA